jgi:nucleoside-diphosphate-sugar epimerase
LPEHRAHWCVQRRVTHSQEATSTAAQQPRVATHFPRTLRKHRAAFFYPIRSNMAAAPPALGQHVFVTGGCGFIGAWIVKQLLDAGDRVTVFDMTLFTKRWESILTAAQIASIAFVQGRVDEPELVDAIVAAAPDAVIHLAGVQVPACRDNPVMGARVNVIGTLNVFEAAKAVAAAGRPAPRIVYASSAAVFGPDAEYATETAVGDASAPKPSSHYGAFKLCCEFAARAYWLANGLPSVGLRPLTVYGPGRHAGITSFPTRAVAAAVKGVPFDIPFRGKTSYIHVREVADMFVTAAKQAAADAKVYTVGGDTADTATFIGLLDKAAPGAASLITSSGGDLPIASTLDDAALRADYPGLLRISLADGVAETVAIYRQLEARGALTV